jgi:hypothetical protein
MRFIKRILARTYCIAFALCAMAAGAVRGQSEVSKSVAQQGEGRTIWKDCRQYYEAPGAYSHCALRMHESMLLQGDTPDTVSRRKPLRPLNIADFVQGDSAIHYAAVYHRAEMWHSGLVATGGTLVAGAIVSRWVCPKRFCARPTNGVMSRNSTLYAGAGLLAVSIPFRVSAYRSGHKAIDFFNASLGK